MSANARNSMVSTAKPNPVVIFGIDSRGKPKGARFAKEYAGLATKAATQLRLQILGSNTPNVAEIAARLPVGRVHANGRTFVPFIRRDLYDKLLAAAASGSVAEAPNSPANAPPSAGGAGGNAKPNLPRTWQEISIGDLVIAQESLEDGWYEAIAMDISGDMITLRWRDYPKERRFVRHRRRLGLLYPEIGPSAQQSQIDQSVVGEAGKIDQHKGRTSCLCPKNGATSTSIPLCSLETKALCQPGGKPFRSRRPVTASNCVGAITQTSRRLPGRACN